MNTGRVSRCPAVGVRLRSSVGIKELIMRETSSTTRAFRRSRGSILTELAHPVDCQLILRIARTVGCGVSTVQRFLQITKPLASIRY